MAILQIVRQEVTNGTSYAFNTTSTSFTLDVQGATAVDDYVFVFTANLSSTGTVSVNGNACSQLWQTQHTSDPDNPLITCWGVANPFAAGTSTPNVTIGGGGWDDGNGAYKCIGVSGIDINNILPFTPSTISANTTHLHEFATDQGAQNNQLYLVCCTAANPGTNSNQLSFDEPGSTITFLGESAAVGAFTPTGSDFPESGNSWNMRIYTNIVGNFIGAALFDEEVVVDPVDIQFTSTAATENQSTAIVAYGPIVSTVDAQLLLGVS